MKRTVLGLAAAALFAAPAAAPAANNAPPAGMIEHTVSVLSFEGDYAVEGVVPRRERFERWVSADRARQVVTDAATGALRGESAEAPRWFSAFDATRNEVWTVEGDGAGSPRGLFVRTLAQSGAYVAQQVAMGWYVKTGDTSYLGRAAIKLTSTGAGAASEGDTKTTILADAETYAPYEVVTVGREGGRTFTQRDRLEAVELLPLAGNERLLAMGSHTGAERVSASQQSTRIRGERERARRADARKKGPKKSSKVKTRRG